MNVLPKEQEKAALSSIIGWRGNPVFSEKLKSLRNEKGLTQEDVAKGIFVSRSVIAKYETGRAYPNKENLEKLALFFDVRIEDLIESQDTTLEFAESKSISEKVNFVCLVAVASISLFIAIFVFVPAFHGWRYVYPIPDGSMEPEVEYFWASIFSATFRNGNVIVLILLLLAIITCSMGIVSIILRRKKCSAFLNLATYILFAIEAFTFFFAVTYTLGSIS